MCVQWAFALPVTLLRIPYSLVESFVWSIIIYWSVGLAPSAARSARDSSIPITLCKICMHGRSLQEGNHHFLQIPQTHE